MDERYRLDIQVLDTQHREIDNLVKSLGAAVGEGEPATRLRQILVNLYELLSFHFAVEESIMQIVSYPFVLEHQSAHRKILDRLAGFNSDSQQDGELEGVDRLVREMFATDAVKHDRVFADFAKSYWEISKL